jgi:hypothetical protein
MLDIRLHVIVVSTFAVAPALAGCGRADTAHETFAVTGVVTKGGEPVAGALVQFYPRSEDYGPLAEGTEATGGQATTADDGSYAVESTFDMGKTGVQGLPAGSYAVTVTKLDIAGVASLDRPPKNVLDPQYASVDSSPVKVTIRADGENKVDISM